MGYPAPGKIMGYEAATRWRSKRNFGTNRESPEIEVASGIMADTWTKQKRSEVMSLVRSRGNKNTELVVARLFRENGITGWRRHPPIFGKPDFAFYRHRLALFIDGCFWHRCPEHAREPKSNLDFWSKKFFANKKRDRLVNRTLRAQGWRVLRIWEHELTRQRQKKLLSRISATFKLRLKPQKEMKQED